MDILLLALGVETNPTGGIILFDDLNYIEVINGQMYVTSLYNKMQPLIRYRLSDKLSIKNDAPLGKCNFTRAESILGRDKDIMWFANQNGNREFRQVTTEVFEIVVETEEHADLKRIHMELTELINSILEKKKMQFVHYSIRYVDQIKPDSRTGKNR